MLTTNNDNNSWIKNSNNTQTKLKKSRSRSLSRLTNRIQASLSINRSKSQGRYDDRLDLKSCIVTNNKIFSTLQPDYCKDESNGINTTSISSNSSSLSFDTTSSSSLSTSSMSSSKFYTQKDLNNVRHELLMRCLTVTKAFEILKEIQIRSLACYSPKSCPNAHKQLFKDVICMKEFHSLFQEEIIRAQTRDLPLSLVFSSPIVNSALNWYKAFYTTFQARLMHLKELEEKDRHFSSISDRVLVEKSRNNINNANGMEFSNLSWLLISIKDSLFHYEVLLERYADYLEDNLEKSRIKNAISTIQNILQNCCINCDYNDFLITQQEYNLLSTREPLIPSVRFIHKGNVYLVDRARSSLKSRMVFLFSDKIYFTKKNLKSSSYRIKQTLNLSSCQYTLSNQQPSNYLYTRRTNTSTSHTSTSSSVSSTNRSRYSNVINEDALIVRITSSDLSNYDACLEMVIENEQEWLEWIDKLNFSIYAAQQRKRSFVTKVMNYESQEHSTTSSLKSTEQGNRPLKNLGLETPRWQKPSNTTFCNGSSCQTRFKPTQKRIHCCSDGLLYCQPCINQSIYLDYCKALRSICEECHELLKPQPNHGIARQSNKILQRQLEKFQKISRNFGLIQGYLEFITIDDQQCGSSATVSSLQNSFYNNNTTKRLLYCVLTDECMLYCYERKEDKYHMVPIDLAQSLVCDNETGFIVILNKPESLSSVGIKSELLEDNERWRRCLRETQKLSISNQ